MPGRTTKYSPMMDGQLKMRIISVLDSASDTINPTIEWIKSQDMFLAPHTTQKLSRILGSLVEMGVVKKAKSKALGKMVYRLTSKLEENGYCTNALMPKNRQWNGMDWEVEDERNQEIEVEVIENG